MSEHTHRGWYSRGYLPHADIDAPQLITFRLADSLPKKVLLKLLAETKDSDPRRYARFLKLLNAGQGSCVLRRNDCAQIVINTLNFYDQAHYRLIAWVVMPNHVHVAYDNATVPMAKIVKNWKGYSSKMIKRLLGTAGDGEPLWHVGYHDRFARDDAHLAQMIAYIHTNPVRAGLVERADDWPFTWISPAAPSPAHPNLTAEDARAL